MATIQVKEATAANAAEVSRLVKDLLLELEPDSRDKIEALQLTRVTQSLLASEKIWAYLGVHEGAAVGVVTLHECAAIYAGGLFGEISELYVKPEYRSAQVGALLIQAAVEKGKSLDWARIEVGTPPPDGYPRTIAFYERHHFSNTGARMRRLIA